MATTRAFAIEAPVNTSITNTEELVFSTGEQVERSQKKPKNKKKKKSKN